MSLSTTLRFDVLRRDGFTCRYCGRKPPTVVLEVDHIHPKAAGGPDKEPNLVTACFTCNRGKRDRTGILPPPTVKASPAKFPIGMFFNARASVTGAKPSERWGDVMALQGLVLAVQGAEVWCEVCDDDGFASTTRALPRNGWKGWNFYETDREMRFQWAVDGYRSGRLHYDEVENFEWWDALRFNDTKRLQAIYKAKPWLAPEPHQS